MIPVRAAVERNTRNAAEGNQMSSLHFMRSANIWRFLAAALTGFLLACSFPMPPLISSLHGATAAWLALVPIIILVCLTPPGKSFLWCFASGLLFWLITVSWLLRLSNTWGSPILVFLGWIAVSAYCAVYIGFFGFISSGIYRFLKQKNRFLATVLFMFLLPVVWVGLEYIRSILFTGFPWNTLGVSQYENLALIQIAQLGGVYAVSAILVLINTSLALTAVSVVVESRQRNRRRRLHYELMIGLLSLAICWTWGVRKVRSLAVLEKDGRNVVIGTVQPGTQQRIKWSDIDNDAIYDTLETQSRLVSMGKPDLILWPETAIPAMLRYNSRAQSFVANITTSGIPVLVGSMDCDIDGENITYFNSSFLVDSSGKIQGEYRKQHLVPFGEYLPLENQISLIKRLAPLGFSCSPGKVETIFSLPSADMIRFSVLICFEDIHSYLARAFVINGARYLVNQTNDAWFEDSAAAMQHMAHCVFRSIENRVPVVRSANTGVTCFIDRLGRVLSILQDSKGNTNFKGFKISNISAPADNMSLTVYTRYGDWIFAIPSAIMILLLLGFGMFLKRKQR